MSRSLDDLNPEFRLAVDPFLADCKAAGMDLIVTCTSRTMDEQAALYAQGRTAPGHIVTNAKPGQSAHNYGLAIDVVPCVNGKLIWDADHPIWSEVGNFGLARGLEWLGVPESPFLEKPHFQMAKWTSLIAK